MGAEGLGRRQVRDRRAEAGRRVQDHDEAPRAGRVGLEGAQAAAGAEAAVPVRDARGLVREQARGRDAGRDADAPEGQRPVPVRRHGDGLGPAGPRRGAARAPSVPGDRRPPDAPRHRRPALRRSGRGEVDRHVRHGDFGRFRGGRPRGDRVPEDAQGGGRQEARHRWAQRGRADRADLRGEVEGRGLHRAARGHRDQRGGVAAHPVHSPRPRRNAKPRNRRRSSP